MGLDGQKFMRHIAGLRYSNQVSVGQGKTTALGKGKFAGSFPSDAATFENKQDS